MFFRLFLAVRGDGSIQTTSLSEVGGLFMPSRSYGRLSANHIPWFADGSTVYKTNTATVREVCLWRCIYSFAPLG